MSTKILRSTAVSIILFAVW